MDPTISQLREHLLEARRELATIEPRLPNADDDADPTYIRRPLRRATEEIEAALRSPIFVTATD